MARFHTTTPVSDDAVLAKTGKSCEEWYTVLDQAGAAKLSHKEIVAFFVARYSKQVGPWWQQMLTVGYERARGLRDVNQTAQGYVASTSKTIKADVDTVYAAWADGRQRSHWLEGAKPSVRSSTMAKSMGLDWEDGTKVAVAFDAKGAEKCVVTVSHSRLPDKKAVARMKDFWKTALDTMKVRLEE